MMSKACHYSNTMSCNGSAKKKNHQPVKVYVRQRPFSVHELEMHCPNIIQYVTNDELVIKSGFQEKRYGFDQVFGEEASQKEVYDAVVAPLINFMILGYNCTVFAYGQTGTGKTYTMIGNKVATAEESSTGLIPRSVCHLFKELANIDANIEYTVRVSFIEIYNEEVRDLLTSNNNIPLKIFEDPDNKSSVCLKGVKEETVFGIQEVFDWLNIGLMERQTASTTMNRHSSRSHSIFTLSVLTRQLTVEGEELIKTGKLYMVDLAGSENVGRSGSTDVRAREAGNINRSLLTLGKVIKALAQNAQHVPYRDSKLTRILRDSLGGRTKTCMIATISAAANVWDETISTLDYAQVARNVSNCPQVNENRKRANILKDLKEEIGRLRKELAAARAGEGFYISKANYEKLCEEVKQNENEIVENKKKAAELIKTNQTLETERERIKEQLLTLNACFEETKRELEEKKHQSKRTEYVLNYLDKRETELKAAADYLWKVCELSTKHEDLFFNKYQKQCEFTLQNAIAAKNAYCAYSDSLQMLRSVTQTYSDGQKYAFSEIQSNADSLKDTNIKMFNYLLECSQKLYTSSNINSLKTDIDTISSDLEKHYNILLNCGFFEAQKNGIRDLEQYNTTKIQEVELITSRCVNTVKQALNDYVLCVTDIMKTNQSMIGLVKTSIENDELNWKNTANNCKENYGIVIKEIIGEVDNKVNCHINESNKVIRNLSREVDGIRMQFMTEFENKINDLISNFETAHNNHRNYEATIKKFADQSLERFKREMEENVQFVAHAGDTPAKRIYKYPSKIEDKLPVLTLYQQFEDDES